jgi:hypothetical protein
VRPGSRRFWPGITSAALLVATAVVLAINALPTEPDVAHLGEAAMEPSVESSVKTTTTPASDAKLAVG